MGKLVRDRIPEIIKNDSRVCEYHILEDAEYQLELKQKLLEEAEEVRLAEDHELIEELADVLEVVECIIKVYRIEVEELLKLKQIKQNSNGSFLEKLYLDKVGE